MQSIGEGTEEFCIPLNTPPDYHALSAGFLVDEGNRRRAYWTAFVAFGRLPGSAIGLRWLRLWTIGPIIGTLLFIGGAIWSQIAIDVELSLSWPWLAAPAAVVAVLLGIGYPVLIPWYYVFVVSRCSDRVALFDDRNAFMTVKLGGRDEDGFWVLEAKNFVSTKHRGRVATHLMTTLLKRIDDAGDLRVVGRAQTRKLAEDYYRDDYGFVLGPGRRISYPT